MAAMNFPAQGVPDLVRDIQAATTSLDAIMREDGIHPHTPLGTWIRALRHTLDLTASLGEAMIDRTEQLIVSQRAAIDEGSRSLRETRAGITDAYKTINLIKETAERRLGNQAISMQRDHEAAVAKMVDGVTQGLRTEVFKALKEQLPLAERRYFYEARWRSWTRLAGAAAMVLALGGVAGVGYSWHEARLGSECEIKDNVVIASNGYAYCRIPSRDTIPTRKRMEGG